MLIVVHNRDKFSIRATELQSRVFILLSSSLHFAPGPQSAVRSLQSAFYTDRPAVWICSL